MSTLPDSYEKVAPTDITAGAQQQNHIDRTSPVSAISQSHPSQMTRSSSESSSMTSLKTGRTARFAESTTVYSPIESSENGLSPFADPSAISEKQHHVSDVGFGYVNENDPARHTPHPPATPISPLRSALKTPGTPGRLNPLSPTFREELVLEKREKTTEKANAKDMIVKARIRVAKVFLRFVNFGCSLIVLSLITTTFTIFNATKDLPPRNNLPPWAIGTNPWPQILLLVLASVSLVTCMIVFYGYWKGGHRRATSLGIYYSTFSIAFFTFSVIMWVVGASLFQSSKGSNGGSDIWSWSCKQNTRSELFQSDINYSLICRLQDWSLLCSIIEVVIEVFVILIYAIVFYRMYSKRRLMKTMELRDKARSDLYLAHLRVQSAPNTPGFPRTPKSPYFATMPVQDPYSAAENGESYTVQYAMPRSPTRTLQQPFQLQPPPIRTSHVSDKLKQEDVSCSSAGSETINKHMGAAPGEKTYESVPIPGALSSPLTSPNFPPQAK